MSELFDKILNNKGCLSKFVKNGHQTACVYPTPYDKPEVVRWFYSRNNGCQIFYACSKLVSDKIDEDSWADVEENFTIYVESSLFDFCIENTDWQPCHRYAIDYDTNAYQRDDKGKFTGGFDKGCGGTICHCEPFGEGDFTNGIAEEIEFNF